MNLFNLLFGFRGRIGRAQFWLVVLIQVAFFFAVVGSLMVAFPASLDTVFDPTIVAYVPLVVSAVAIGIKRLHDRNKSGWWLLLFWLVPNLLGSVPMSAAGTVFGTLVVALASFVIFIWGFVEIGGLKGTTGPNDYGPDPLPT